MRLKTSIFALALALSATLGAANHAQALTTSPTQIASVSPTRLDFGIISADYEPIVNQTATIGVGDSFYSHDDKASVSAHTSYGYHPQGHRINSFSLDSHAALNNVGTDGNDLCDDNYYGSVTHRNYNDANDQSAVALSIGATLDGQWVLGAQKHFTIAPSTRTKRPFSVADLTNTSITYPTARRSVGYDT